MTLYIYIIKFCKFSPFFRPNDISISLTAKMFKKITCQTKYISLNEIWKSTFFPVNEILICFKLMCLLHLFFFKTKTRNKHQRMQTIIIIIRLWVLVPAIMNSASAWGWLFLYVTLAVYTCGQHFRSHVGLSVLCQPWQHVLYRLMVWVTVTYIQRWLKYDIGLLARL